MFSISCKNDYSPEIGMYGNHANGEKIEIKPTRLAFGTVFGDSTKILIFSITNIGYSPFIVETMIVRTPFSIIGSRRFSVRGGKQRDVYVKINPTHSGWHSGGINIIWKNNSNDIENISDYYVELGGSGEYPAKTSVSPDGFNFGTVLVDSTKIFIMTLYIHSPILDISVNNPNFVINVPSSLPINTRRNIAVKFTPIGITNFTGILTIVSEDSTIKCVLRGRGASPIISVIADTLGFEVDSIDGYQDQSLRIGNVGDLLLKVEDIKISNPNFTLLDTTNYAISPLQFAVVRFRYRATGLDTETGTISIFCNDPKNKLVTVYLKGTTFH